MDIIFATGGLDEAAVDVGYIICASASLAATGLIAFSWWKHSLIAAIIGCIFVTLDGVLISPWMFILPRPEAPYPYDLPWQSTMRIISIIWALLACVAAGCLISAVRYRKLKRNAPNPS